MTVVYIVDDQIINLRILERFARSLEDHVDVRTFDDPLRALAAFGETPPDLVVTDYVMPTMDGQTFIKRCRRHPAAADAPIIVVTAFEDRDLRYRALDTGASDFLLSPVDGREFCIRARNLLSLRRLQLADRERAVALESRLETTLRRHADEMRRKKEQLRRIINTVPALISATDPNGAILLMNSRHQRYCGDDWSAAVGATTNELFGDSYAARHRAIEHDILESGAAPIAFEESVVDAAGEERILLTTKAPLSGTDDFSPGGIVTVSLDITERKQDEQAVIESEQRFRALVEGSVLGIVIERDGRPLFANGTLARLFGYDGCDEIYTLDSVDALFVADERELIHHLRQTVLAGEPHGETTELRGCKRDGEPIWLQAQAQRVAWKGRPAVQYTLIDVTMRKAYQAQLERQANFDAITDMPNRQLMMDRLRGAVISATRHGHRGGVLFIDLDHFKKVNDNLGHAAGDQLLKLAADRLRRCVREEDTVARIGGDEFTVLLPKIGSASNAEPVARKILRAFSQSFELSGQEAFVSASIGITIFPDDGDNPDDLIKNADTAMYRSKARGRNTFEFFTTALNRQAKEQIKTETCLRHAIERDEFRLLFQPIIDIRSAQVVSAQAIVDWQNTELGLVAPDRLIACAKEAGLIAPIRYWILNAACREWGRWEQGGASPPRVAVDACYAETSGTSLIEMVRKTLAQHEVPAELLELKISERCLTTDGTELQAVIEGLNDLGVSVAIDDFGSSYGWLRYLSDARSATIKLHQSLFYDGPESAKRAKIVEAIVAMAHRLNIRVAAKGIDTVGLLSFARSCGCDLAQGEYLGAAMTASEFRAWTTRNRTVLRMDARTQLGPMGGEDISLGKAAR